MGHREDLLAGAKQCLYERGYARTTARDIVAVSGTNLASIGYHFGSMQALLNAAMIEAIEEWGHALEQTLATATTKGGLARFEAIWKQIIQSFETHRALWIATSEALVQAEHAPEVRIFLADTLNQARFGLASLFHGTDSEIEPRYSRQIGSFYQALLTGVWVQWLIDSHHAPSATELTIALQEIWKNLRSSEPPTIIE